MRILITGSRTWDNENFIRNLLSGFGFNPDVVTLVSGNCQDGADAICEKVAEELGWAIERHPADWETHGRKAGFIRNYNMAHTHPDICLAFVRDHSAGASMTAKFAKDAGVQTYILNYPEVS